MFKISSHAKVLAASLSLVFTGLVSTAANAADPYPTRTITIVLASTAGGTSDMLARTVADHLSRVWKQPVVVEARPGAGGQIGMDYVARSKPDGYTLALSGSGVMAVNPFVFQKLRYDPLKDFDSITVLADFPLLLVVSSNVPAKNLAEFLALAKAQPGKISMGNIGTGTHQYLGQMQFAQMANIEPLMVAYKGSAPQITDFLGGTLDSIFDNVATQLPYIQSGKSRPIAVTSKVRSPLLPDVPTIDEAGVPGYETTPWLGLAAPAGTPKEIINQLQAEIAKLFAQPEIRQKLRDAGVLPVANSPAEATQRVKDNLATIGKIAKDINLQPQ